MPRSLSVDDRFRLGELAALYAVAIDDRTFERLRQVFTADCTLDTGTTTRTGIDAVIGAMEGLRRYRSTMHLVGHQLVEVIDDEVVGITYCTAHHLTDNGDHDTDMVMHIRYHDRFAATDDGWRIMVRRLEVMWTDESTVR